MWEFSSPSPVFCYVFLSEIWRMACIIGIQTNHREDCLWIGNYRLTHKLGAGGMGVVFRAVDRFDRPFAIKMIGSRATIDATLHVNKALLNAPALDLKSRMMLVREARVVMELGHPNIVRTFDYGQHEGLLYIVSEFLHGSSLDKMLPHHGALSLATKLRIIRQICDALQYAHQRGVIHRDVKPANTFVQKDFHVKVLDFGLAARLREPRPGQGAFAGTPHYVAPEVAMGSSVYDARVDIWSTGVTMYQLLTGRVPFYANSFSELLQNIVHLPYHPLNPNYPQVTELTRMLDRALAKNPTERYPSAEDFSHDLILLEDKITGPQLLRSRAADTDADRGASPKLTYLPSTSPARPDQSDEAVSMIAGSIRARRGRHTRRFVIYYAMVSPLLLGGTIVSVLFVLFFIAFRVFDAPTHASFVEVLRYVFWVKRLLPLHLIVLGPPVIIGLVLAGFAIREKFAEIPRCCSCKLWMKHLSRIDRFSYTDASRAHAASDCVAALKEDLWEDAAKLLSMHGELFLPKAKTKLSLVRYYLDFYLCRTCGDESAMLTTEDGKGTVLRPSEEYVGAYKAKNRPTASPPNAQHWSRFKEALKRAATVAMESTDYTINKSVVIWVLVLSLWCGPRFRTIFEPAWLGTGIAQVSVTIDSSPQGQSIFVDGKSVVTPKTFAWPIDSIHTIAGFSDRQIDGSLYHFLGLTGKHPDSRGLALDDRVVCGFSGPTPPKECTITIRGDGQTGQWQPRPLMPSYKVYFTNAKLSDTPDKGASPRYRFRESSGAKTNQSTATDFRTPVDQIEQKVIVTSVPAGLSVMVDKDWILTPKIYHWRINSTHTLTAPAGYQVFSQSKTSTDSAEPIYYNDGRWSNSGEHTINITISGAVGPEAITYSADFRLATIPPIGQTAPQPNTVK